MSRHWAGNLIGSATALLTAWVLFLGIRVVLAPVREPGHPGVDVDFGVPGSLMLIVLAYLFVFFIASVLSTIGASVAEYFRWTHWLVFACGGGVPSIGVFSFFASPLSRANGLELCILFAVAFATGAIGGLTYWAVAVRLVAIRANRAPSMGAGPDRS